MQRCRSMGLRAILSLVVAALGCSCQVPVKHPNVILFVVDDMGWLDSGVYGSRYYETPSIDRLAREGIRFTAAYSASPVCSPTRASILTGKYPARLGITAAVCHLKPLPQETPRFEERAPSHVQFLKPTSLRYLPLEEETLAETLRAAGYVTAHLGKWHLSGVPEYFPDQHGFDFTFHGFPDASAPSYFSPYGFRLGNVTDVVSGEYLTDRLTTEAVRFLREHREEPFFVNLWHFGVHAPYEAKEDLIEQYRGREDPRGFQGNPYMAAMLKSIDESLGRILAELDALHLAERTVVIFTSDNGGRTYGTWGGVGPDALTPTSNLPLRRGKGWLYEGGIRVPLIIRYPPMVEVGSFSDEPVSTIDFWPTVVELAHLDPSGTVIDGESLVPVLKGTGGLRREALFNFYPHGQPRNPPGVTVRQGDWKLIRWFETNPIFPERLELYDLSSDVGETRNLASEEPMIVALLDGLIDAFLEDTHALVPEPNPAYRPIPLRGWQPLASTGSVRDGKLRLAPGADRTFVVSNVHLREERYSGPLMLLVRIRGDVAGQGKVLWQVEGQENFEAAGQNAPLPLAGDGSFHDVLVELPLEKRLVRLGISLPRSLGATDIERIVLYTPVAGERTLRPGYAAQEAWTFAEE